MSGPLGSAVGHLRTCLTEASMQEALAHEQGDAKGAATHQGTVDRLRAALRELGELGYVELRPSPWDALREAAADLSRMYAPGDDSPDLGRCDVDLLLDALTGARLTCEAHLGHPGVDACHELLCALEAVARGLRGDLSDVAASARELAHAVALLRGPGVAPWVASGKGPTPGVDHA